MPRVIHFDISADNPERAIGFYREAFGWKIEKWRGPFDYWLIKTGEAGEPGIDGGLARRDDPSASITSIVAVPSVDDFAERIATSGGKIVHPRQTIPGVGYLVTCQDTEGNVFAIMEMDESAK